MSLYFLIRLAGDSSVGIDPGLFMELFNGTDKFWEASCDSLPFRFSGAVYFALFSGSFETRASSYGLVGS